VFHVERYSYSFMFVPSPGMPGRFTFYATRTIWDGEECLKAETLIERQVNDIAEISHPEQWLGNAIHMADRAYQEVTDSYAKSESLRTGEINGRPSSASTN